MSVEPFPENIIAVLREKLQELDGVEAIVARSLEPTDPNGCIGIVVDGWRMEDVEMGGFGETASIYEFSIQHMVKHTNQEEGQKTHRLVARNLRRMLVRDQSLRVALGQLQDGEYPVERSLLWKVPTQRFASDEIAGQFVFLSVTELNFHTQTS